MTMPLDFDKTKNFTSVEIQTFTITVFLPSFSTLKEDFYLLIKRYFDDSFETMHFSLNSHLKKVNKNI